MEPAAITDTKPAARRWLGWLGQCGRYCRINYVISGKLLPIKNLCIGKDIAEITRDTLTWFSQRWENFPQRLSLTPAKDALRLFREKCKPYLALINRCTHGRYRRTKSLLISANSWPHLTTSEGPKKLEAKRESHRMISQRYTALASDKAHAHRYLEGRESHVWRHYAATGDDDFSKRIKTSKNVRTRCVIQRAALHDAPCRSFPDLAQIQWINRK